MLLLAFGLGLAGQVTSTAAMAAQMQSVAGPGIASDHPCPKCPGDQHGGMAIGCSAVACWTAPALAAQSTITESVPPVAFTASPDVMIVGIATAPDPHPPRLLLHT